VRKLNSSHERYLINQGLRIRDFMYVSKDYESYTFLYIPTGKEVVMRR